GAASPFEGERVDARTGQQRQVRSVERREKVAMDDAETLTVLGIEIHITRAVSYRRANVLQNLMPHFLASLEESNGQGIRVRHRFDMHGTIRATIGAQAFPCTSLDALENRLEACIIPPLATRIGPLIEVDRSPPDPYHRIDAAGPAEDLSPGP